MGKVETQTVTTGWGQGRQISRVETWKRAKLTVALATLVVLLVHVVPLVPVVPHMPQSRIFAANSRSEDPVCEKLQRWVWNAGGRIEGIRCVNRPMEGGRGLVTARTLYPTDVVFQLPTTAAIMSSTIKLHTPMLFDVLDNDPVLVRECGKKWAATGTACRLALALVYLSAGGDNFWGSVYFDTVPTKPPSLVWWNHSYLNQFESPILKDRIEEYKADHRSNFHTIGKHMIRTYPDMWGNLTFDRFLWGALLVETRTFSCPGGPMDASESTWCLVPYIDMINHQSYSQSDYGMDLVEEGWFHLLASEAYEDNADIFISYGSHRLTRHFLEAYGFVPGGYDHQDTVGFSLARKPASVDIVGVASIDGCIRQGGGRTFIRTVAAEISGASAVSDVTFLEIAAAQKYLRDQITSRLASFSTTYEFDANRVVSGEVLHFNERLVLSVRSRYKRILHAVLQQLDKPPDEPCVESAWVGAGEIAETASNAHGMETDSWLYEVVLTPP